MEKYNILLVEDSDDIIEFVSLYLTNAGFDVTTLKNYSQVLQVIEKQRFDLILLDILLPDTTGYDLCKKIREKIFCPIIFMSCLDAEHNITKALELGGDDYIIKPVRPKEIVARIKANLRRVEQYATFQKKDNKYIEFGGFILDTQKHTVKSSKGRSNLTPLEFNILIYLLQHERQMVSYKELFENVWKTQVLDDYRTVQVHVSNLKNKIKKVNNSQNFIINIRGEGYILKR